MLKLSLQNAKKPLPGEGALISDKAELQTHETPKASNSPKDFKKKATDENNMKQVDKKDIPEVNDTTVTKITDVERQCCYCR